MRAVLDTCVIYPTVMREALFAVSETGAFEPILSERILVEWQRAVARDGPLVLAQASLERTQLLERWPEAIHEPDPARARELYLPDANDIHVLALAITTAANVIVTANLKDFPKRELAPFGIRTEHPDIFLTNCLNAAPDVVAKALLQVLDKARSLSGQDFTARTLFKKARLPRLARNLERVQNG